MKVLQYLVVFLLIFFLCICIVNIYRTYARRGICVKKGIYKAKNVSNDDNKEKKLPTTISYILLSSAVVSDEYGNKRSSVITTDDDDDDNIKISCEVIDKDLLPFFKNFYVILTSMKDNLIDKDGNEATTIYITDNNSSPNEYAKTIQLIDEEMFMMSQELKKAYNSKKITKYCYIAKIDDDGNILSAQCNRLWYKEVVEVGYTAEQVESITKTTKSEKNTITFFFFAETL